jgi:hypothetical protein
VLVRLEMEHLLWELLVLELQQMVPLIIVLQVEQRIVAPWEELEIALHQGVEHLGIPGMSWC